MATGVTRWPPHRRHWEILSRVLFVLGLVAVAAVSVLIAAG